MRIPGCSCGFDFDFHLYSIPCFGFGFFLQNNLFFPQCQLTLSSTLARNYKGGFSEVT